MKFLELPLGAVFTVTDWFYSPTYVKISNVCCPDNSNRTYINAYNRMNDVGALLDYATECTECRLLDIKSTEYEELVKQCETQGCVHTTYATLLTQIQYLRSKKNGTLRYTENLCGSTKIQFQYSSADEHSEFVEIHYHETDNTFIEYEFAYFKSESIHSSYAYSVRLQFNKTGELVSYVCRNKLIEDIICKCNILEIVDYFTTQEVYRLIFSILKEVDTMKTEHTHQFTDDTMDNKALNLVLDYTLDHLDKSDDLPNLLDVYIVWKSKILQNWKYLISTNLYDGMYYELTYNGDKKEWYLDAYKKFENKVIKDE